MLTLPTYFQSQHDTLEATMKVVSIHSLKGGTGKTMITTNLAVEAERAGHTVAIIDLDPPATATKWGDHRESESPAVVATPSSRLKHWLEVAQSNGASFVMIDTPPSPDPFMHDVVKASSLVMIPCQPSLADIEANEPTIATVLNQQKPCFVVLNMVRSNTGLDIHARKSIREYGVVCAPVQIGNRVGFIHAYNSGASITEIEPKSKSADEIRALYAYLAKQME